MRMRGRWHAGTVEKVDRAAQRVLLRPVVAKSLKEFDMQWYEFMRCVGGPRWPVATAPVGLWACLV
jgi:hypothetical protein